MAKIVRMKDIGEKLGVSTVTVSKAFSGQKGVSEKLRAEILKTAQEMGYEPPASRKERTGISYNIGVLIASRYLDKSSSFYGQMLQHVTTEASGRNCFTMLETITDEMESECMQPQCIKSGNIDGIILIGYLAEHYLETIESICSLPMIYLDFSGNMRGRDCIISDSFYGAYQLTNYLCDNGHREIAYVGTVLSTSSITDRYLGYMKAMMEHHCEIRPEWIIDDRRTDNGLIDPEHLLQLPEQLPTAFFCNCDLAASHLLRKLEARGVNCPSDVSIVGYDNFTYDEFSDVSFTTYEVDMKEMSRKAVSNLIHKLNGEYYRRGVIIIAGKMIEKGSVKARASTSL
ncbi:MAG: LacI family DNA-binding transcriptional regulator [Lachnospiraceae bacterium]|nr:LacI family DNA-binding transcriptional regulator [Lachnospiraceae bacterium]